LDAELVIFLDANATTPLLPEVLDAMLPWLRDGFANPSGAYTGAKLARKAIDQARAEVAEWIGAEPSEIVFTGGGTESVNTALYSFDRQAGSGAAVVSGIEHSAVLRCVESFSREVRCVPVTAGGRLDMDAFMKALDGAAYVSVMAANNETGVIQPLREVVTLAHERGIPVHSDAIQAAGKMPLNVKELGVDLLSLSAHKFHGPKGVGALYISEGLRFQPLLLGGGQESGRRSGTENTAGIVGMGAAATAAKLLELESIRAMRDFFEAKVIRETAGVSPNGDPNHRLTNTCHLSFDGCDAAGLLILLDQAGIACAAGSACMTGKQRPSHVQLAMGISESRAKSSLRISFSKLNTMEETSAAADILIKSVAKLRHVQGHGVGPVSIYSV
jgi:cysteine desulfurase